MPKIDSIKQYVHSMNSLEKDVKSLKPYTKEHVKDMFGTVGTDIFEKKKPSITNKSKITGKSKFLNKVAGYLGLNSHQTEIRRNDNIRKVCLKYANNYGSGLEKDWNEKFGKVGTEVLKSMRRLGIIDK